MDWLRVVILLEVLALVVAVAAGAILVYNNLASKTLVLAGSAFIGAVLIFGINLWTELRGSTTRDRLSVEYAIDRAGPSIRTWRYPIHGDGGQRLVVETGASDWLATHNAAAFAGDRDRLTLDLALFSLIGLLTSREFDWQLRQVIYEGDVSGTLIQFGRVSKIGECREYSKDDLSHALQGAGNVFGGAPLFVVGGAVCLPPGGELHVTSSSITLRTPICQVSFQVESSGGVSYMVPRTGGRVEKLQDGSSRYEIRVVGVAVEITSFALRAQHRDAEKQLAWCHRVVDSARHWFAHAEPEPPEPLQPWVRPGAVAPVPE